MNIYCKIRLSYSSALQIHCFVTFIGEYTCVPCHHLHLYPCDIAWCILNKDEDSEHKSLNEPIVGRDQTVYCIRQLLEDDEAGKVLC